MTGFVVQGHIGYYKCFHKYAMIKDTFILQFTHMKYWGMTWEQVVSGEASDNTLSSLQY